MAIAPTYDDNMMQITATRRRSASGPIWMQAIAFFWFLSTFAIFPGNSLILYPMAASFFVIIFFHRHTVIPLFAKGWIIFIVPIIGVLSFTWGDYPNAALREGMFFLLSAVSVTVIAAMLSERQIIRAMFFCAVLGTGLAATEAGTIVSNGSQYLGGKNFFATKMLISLIVSFAVAFNKEELLPIRLAGFALLPINLGLVVVAQATTALLLSLVALIMFVTAQFFWVGARKIQGLRVFVIMAALAAGLLIIIQVLNLSASQVVDDFLGSVGKDSTLTGRTNLWATAEIWAERNPILGVGLGGFWQPAVGAAQTLNELDHKAFGTALGFHNSYLEVRVALGYVGLIPFIATLAWVLWHNIKSFLIEGSIERTAFLVAGLVLFGMTFTESVMFGYLTPMVYMFYLGAMTVVANKLRREKILVNVKLTDD